MAAELAAVQEAGAKLQSARNGEDTLSAMMGVQEMTTTPAGARAAGVDEERYKMMRNDLSAAVGYLTPHLGGIDTTLLSAAQREEMRQMNAAQLKQLEGTVPAEVVEALKPKAEGLRRKEIELAGSPAERSRNVSRAWALTQAHTPQLRDGSGARVGSRCFARIWRPAGPARAILINVHGLGDHSGLYPALVEHFTTLGHRRVRPGRARKRAIRRPARLRRALGGVPRGPRALRCAGPS